MGVIQVSQDSFKKEALDYKGNVFIDFYADWCGPCRMTEPIIHELAEEIKEMKFIKIDVDKNPDLATTYSVFSIPTFIILKDGKPVTQFVGGQSKEGFLQEIHKAISQ